MPKKMLINALHAEEARVAIVEDGRLVDLDVEIAGNEQIRGNIYKGVVVRVEPGLQAAFVDVGLKKLGFLQMGELHPENWKWRDDVPEEQRHKRPRIQEVLRRGQEIIVQVEKGERDNKGSALTTYISLPGRYMVLMPGSDSSGISRKVESESERKKLKEMIAGMNIPEGYGYIIRTEAVGRTVDELQKDLNSLIALYQGVREQGSGMKGAGLIYQESSLIVRTIRDYFSADIDEVLVDSKDVFKDVRDCLKEIDPQFEKLVKMHQEKRPIFSRYQLEEQIDLIYEKKVPLKSGGSIFIEPTEALVSIDVNSGKSTGEKGVEDTAFKTNLEAAEEAARQLRLRDLGGLIVIDFIDMRDRKHNAEVERTLKTALKADKARVNVARISEFGLLEMSRQRIRQTLHQASTLECPHCDGRGKVKSVEAMALSFLRKVHAAAAKGVIADVIGSLPLEVAYYLLNRKRRELSQIENDYDIQVTVKGKPSFLLNQMELELVRREKVLLEEAPAEKVALRAGKEEVPQEGERKKKKRGKGKGAAEEVHPAVVELPVAAAEMAATEAAGEPAAALEPAVAAEGETEEPKKKRRRRRKRGKGGGAEGAAAEAAVAEDAGAPAEGEAAEGAEGAPEVLEGAPAAAEETPEGAAAAEVTGEEGKKKRRRKRRRGGKHPQEGAQAEAAAEADVAGEGEPHAEPEEEIAVPLPAEPVAAGAEKPKRSRGRRKKAAAGAAGEGAVEALLEGAGEEEITVAAVMVEPIEVVVPFEIIQPAEVVLPVEIVQPLEEALADVELQEGEADAEVLEGESAAESEEAAEEEPLEAQQPVEVEHPAAEEQPPAQPAEGEQPALPEASASAAEKPAKPRRSRSRKPKGEKPAAEGAEPAASAEPTVAPVAAPLAGGDAVPQPQPEGNEPARKKRAPRKKGPAQAAPETASAPAEAPAEKPKKPRAPRKKKEQGPAQ
ncbi:Rne/Rng family ribonuclease [Geomonas sp. RF6]|uniref:Rne/Rng family ribonuclease n=1 Tax=Geomonas sp. RF6 TaxID=2897342 RepID=UPI001E2A7B51|nr:Rne/Rng family ribonuclease [Geomonas sp. RF6]UFS71508.1 Rne/Rng family ribonuclease [Geomonas sp. RF6]